jgi:Lrp/AsnC family transcriptional regulator, leucine-responsive regulatory protein
MDDIDRKLITIIQNEGRASYGELGAAVGLSVSAVNERLKKLTGTGVVTGWGARVEPRALGLDVLAFIQVLIDRPEHEEAFRAAMRAFPEVQECHHVTGEWSYLLKLRVAGTAALERFLSDRLKHLSGVIRTHSVIALSSIKDTPILPTESLP